MPHPNWSEVTAYLGGAFDPPHIGHREAALGLLKEPGVGKVWVIPSGTPPLKLRGTPPALRLEMVRRGFPAGIGIEEYEIRRTLDLGSLADRPSYTFETLTELRRTQPKLAFVVGADQLSRMHLWHRFPELLQLAHWIVLTRKPDGLHLSRETLRDWEVSRLVEAVPGSSRPLWKLRDSSYFLTLCETDAPALSSTHIREYIERHGAPPEASLTPEVGTYLKDHRLYGTSGASND